MNRIAAVATLGIGLVLSGEAHAQQPRAGDRATPADEVPYMEGCTVAFIVDGDTFNCADGRRVRLLLVDSPDRGDFGDLSRRALAAVLPVDTTVTLEFDEKRQDPDGRWLAYVYGPDGAMANLVLVRRGLALVEFDRENRRHLETLREAEREARAAGRGIWSE